MGDSKATLAATTGGDRTTAFRDVVCAVNGSRGSAEAARQAIVLAKPGGVVTFIAVFYGTGKGLAETAGLSERRAHEALEEATGLAARMGVKAQVKAHEDRSPNRVLLTEAAHHELTVLGSHGGARAAGIAIGSTATRAAHEAMRALLIARRPIGKWRHFPTKILVATDGSPGSWAAARAAAGIARARDSQVEILSVPSEATAERRQAIGDQVRAIRDLTGVEPTLADGSGHVAQRIVEVARTEQCSLIAIGRRGLSGLRAIGSVSERVVHQARCSVLVVPPDSEPVP